MDVLELNKQIGVGVGKRRRITVGRSLANDILVTDKTVSRQHAVLEMVGSNWRIRDLNSANGSWVNGRRCHRSTPVQVGDEIRLGQVRLRIQDSSLSGAVTVAPDPTHKPVLTAREYDVIRLVAQGFTDAQIARQLFVSIKTVESHLDRIRDKTGARKRPDLTRYALGLDARAS